MDRILDLAISYPDFQLNQIIDPDQVDLNNSQITSKVNVIIKAINDITQGTTGAGQITIKPLPDFPNAKTIQQALEQIASYTKANNVTIGQILSHNTSQDARMTTIESKNTSQDTRMTTIESKNTSQDERMTRIESKDTEQDTRLITIEGVNAVQTNDIATIKTKNTEQDIRLTDAEARLTVNDKKNTEQDSRIAELEVKDDLDESWIRGIDARVGGNTENIARLGNELEEIREVNANAELIEARTSSVYGQTYPSLQARLTDTEIQIKTDVPTNKRTQFNILVTDENVNETWSDSVRLGDISNHEKDDNAHALQFARHELDGTCHSDIRDSVSTVQRNVDNVNNTLSASKADKSYVDAQDQALTNQMNVLSTKTSELFKGNFTGDVLTINDTRHITYFYGELDTVTNMPDGAVSYGIIEYIPSHYPVLRVKSVLGNRTSFENIKTDGGKWVGWQQIATTEEMYTHKLPIVEVETDSMNYYNEVSANMKDDTHYQRMTNHWGYINPIGGGRWLLEGMKTNYLWEWQTIRGYGDGRMFFRRKNNGTWGEWTGVATTDKTEILSSIMLSGWELIKRQSSDTFTISKTGNMVVCNFVVRNPASRNAWDSVLTLPVGFRPKNFIDYTINDNFKIDIYPSGTIQIKQAYTANTQLCFNLSFEGV